MYDTYRNDFQLVKDFYHIYSDGRNVTVLFSDESDYIFGVNRLAICSISYNVEILCFALMESHFHTVVRGSKDNCQKFADECKRIFTRRLGQKNLLKTNIKGKLYVDLLPIETRTDLLNVIIYTYRNPLSSKSNLMPEDYKWGVGHLYFVNHISIEKKGTPLKALSERQKRALFHTYSHLPDEWVIASNGMIMQECFVKWQIVESIFGSPKAFIAFLKIKADDESRIQQLCSRRTIESLSFSDTYRKIETKCNELFGKSLHKCTFKERLCVVTKMVNSKELSVSSNLAKAIDVEFGTLKKLLKEK